MTTVIVLCVIGYVVRLALRRRPRAVPQTPVVVIVVQPASPPPLTIDEEWAHIQARDSAR